MYKFDEARTKLENFFQNISEFSSNEIFEALRCIKEEDEDLYADFLVKLNPKILGNIACIMPEYMLEDILIYINIDNFVKAIEELESDDATDLIQKLENLDKSKALQILNRLELESKEEILLLKKYADDKAGAYMQTEMLKVYEDESIQTALKRYRVLKNLGEIDQIFQVFVIDRCGVFLFSISLSDILLWDFNIKFEEIKRKSPDLLKAHYIYDQSDIQETINLVKDYDLSVVPVLDKDGVLLGRITYDDIHDLIQDQATEQIYHLAGVSDSAEEETLLKASKARAFWLMINLFTSLISANVISFFSGEIEKLVALAALMPIVASMGGNTGTQALSVTVRKLSLGEIDFKNAKSVILREIKISLLNGFVFALIVGVVAFLWFQMPLLGIVIALSMIINLSLAGFIGSFVPLTLKKFKLDPAVGSGVILTALTDSLGFFSFLLLASFILL